MRIVSPMRPTDVTRERANAPTRWNDPADAVVIDQESVVEDRGRTGPSLAGTALRVLVLVAVTASLAGAVVRLWPDVRSTLLGLSLPMVAASFVAALLGMCTAVMSWREILLDLQHTVSFRKAGQIYLVGQLGRYLPGSVWAVALQMELGLRAGIPRARSFAASLVMIGLSLTAGLLVGILGVPSLAAEVGHRAWAVVAVLAVLLLVSAPPILTRMVDTLLRLLRRPGIQHPFSPSGVARPIGWSVLTYLALGTHMYLLVLADQQVGPPSWLTVVGTYAIATVAGVFAVVTPSGLGIREAVLVLSLAPFTGAGAALALALTSRLILLLVDVVAAGAAAWTARRA